MRIELGLLSLLLACSGENVIEKQSNAAPTVMIASHSTDAEVLSGYSEMFRASVSDDDNEFSELSIAWYVGENLVCDWAEASPAGESFCEITFGDDDNNVIVEVRDPQGAGGRDELSIVVLPTEAPTIELLSPNQNTGYYSSELIQFSAMVGDNEDDSEDLLITWTSSQDGELSLDSTPDSTGEISDYTYLTEGNHAIELRVEDSSGKVTKEEIVIQVGGPNETPLCEILEPTDRHAVVEGSSVLFVGEVSDANVDATDLTARWISDKDGDLGLGTITSAGRVNFTSNTLSNNDHIISLIVEDDVGASCTSSIFLFVSQPPTVTIDAPSDGDVVNLGENVVFQGSVSDPESQPNDILVTWTSSIDGELDSGYANSQGESQFFINTLSAGMHSIAVEAEDGSGVTTEEMISLYVNTPPTAPSVTLSPNPVYGHQNLTATGSGSTDADGDALTYTYEWFEDGVLTGHTSNTISSSYLDVGEEWTVRVRANDGFTNGAFTEASIIVSNTAPNIDSLVMTPSAPGMLDTVTCTATVSDLDGGTPVVSFSFLNQTTGASATPTTTNAQSATLDLSSITVSDGDVLVCEATAIDAQGDSDTATTSVGIVNSGPIFTQAATVTPNSNVVIGTELTCTGTVVDPDDGVASTAYSWLVNGTQVASGDVWTVDGSVVGTNDAVSCSIVAVDYSGNSTVSTSNSVIVGNTTPVINSAVINNLAPYTSDNLYVTVNTTDPDGDTITYSYEWHVVDASNGNTDSIAVSGTGPAFAGISGLVSFDRDDEVYVIVTPDDGTAIGAAVESIMLLFANSVPTDPTIALTAPNTPAVAGVDDLTCSIVNVSSDLDGDAFVYTYDWLDDSGTLQRSNSGTMLFDTLSSANSSGGTWTCEVSADDGTGISNIISAQLIVDAGWNGPLSFDNCGVAGRFGPTQADCDASYSGTDLDGDVVVSGGIQSWEVPVNGIYEIDVAGAKGGLTVGGDGAHMVGEFTLTAGQIINIVVGQKGSQQSNWKSGGGGGGSFVWIEGQSTPLIVAGGGGGGNSQYGSVGFGYDGQIGTSGTSGYQGASGGSNGNGGSGSAPSGAGAGGMGWYSSGGTSSYSSNCTGGNHTTFVGGTGYSSIANGGFGGGGGAVCGAGGAGGYSGGGGGQGASWCSAGGGGGSYNSGTSILASGGVNGGHGWVIIDRL